MGAAFTLARLMLEDEEPAQACLILISDGMPTDAWAEPLEALRRPPGGRTAVGFAVAIGEDADESLLKDFADGLSAQMFKALEARDLHQILQAAAAKAAAVAPRRNSAALAGFQALLRKSDDAHQDRPT